MKRILCIMMLLTLLLAAMVPAGAEVFRTEEKPDGWDDRDLLRVTFFPFYQNDAILLECGNQGMLLDGGNSEKAPQLVEMLTERGWAHPTYFFNSHPHDDHVGAQYRAVRNGWMTTDLFISPFSEEYDKADHQMMVEQLRLKGIPYHQMLEGDVFMLGEEGAPQTSMTLMRWETGKDPNALSGVLYVRFGDATILLTADLPGEGQHYFLDTYGPERLHADILKAPHHAIVLMVNDFYKAVDPELVIFTNARNNTKRQTQQVEARGVPILYGTHGTITMETDGTDWYVWQVPLKK